MKVLRVDHPFGAELRGAVVVIDVLRSFTTAACALARGAREVVAVDSLDAALAWRTRDPDALTLGALGGGAPAPGLELGNSPSQVEALDLTGLRVVMCSAGGTRTLVDCSAHAVPLLAASLVCASATADWLRRHAPDSVGLVVTGTWGDRDGDEDHACADLIEALLRGDDPPRGPYEARVRASDFGRRFAAGGDPHLSRADLDCCARADCFDFAMTVERNADGGITLRRQSAHALR